MTRRLLFTLLALVGCGDAHASEKIGESAVVNAQVPGDGVSLTTALGLDRIAARLARSGATGEAFEKRTGMSVVESRRVSDGSVEVHDAWMDVTYVQAGRATLLTGGKVAGAMAVTSPGEHRGGQIVGGTARMLAPGDVVVVPAGMPHQFRIAQGDSIRYLTVKAPK